MICGNCGKDAATVATVKACHAGESGNCGWMVEVPGRWVDATWTNDDGTTESDSDFIEGGIADCGAHVTFTPRGWSCEAGHEHVTAEARHAEGWDWAEEYGEAQAMAAAGVEPFTMSGHVVTGPQSFAP